MLPNITHLIWDCDGCLIDSEIIACRVAAEHYTKAGYPITTEAYIQRFMGKSTKQAADEIMAEAGLDILSAIDWEAKKRDRDQAFATSLKAIPHVTSVLSSINVPMAVASGSEPDRLEYSLKLTNLWDYFNGHVYSASMVKNGKPAPDVFLLAAEKLGANPAQCAVVEDGHHGVHGAKAAGMYVLGFTGASHSTPALTQQLRSAGADHIFADMSQLPSLLKMNASVA